MFGQILYVWLVVVGVVDVFLVAPAIRRVPADNDHTVGRLLATLLVLGGLVVGALGRLFVTVPLSPPVAFGLVMLDVGLLLYALFLPEWGLPDVIRRWWSK